MMIDHKQVVTADFICCVFLVSVAVAPRLCCWLITPSPNIVLPTTDRDFLDMLGDPRWRFFWEAEVLETVGH